MAVTVGFSVASAQTFTFAASVGVPKELHWHVPAIGDRADRAMDPRPHVSARMRTGIQA
jgi:hypothetical protein